MPKRPPAPRGVMLAALALLATGAPARVAMASAPDQTDAVQVLSRDVAQVVSGTSLPRD